MGGKGSGGARARSGPPPDPNALRRNRDGKDWTTLPAAGRLGPAPEWPDSVPEPSPAELIHWRTLWATPQALVWEADRAFDAVALYTRIYCEAMEHSGPGNARTLARQMQGELLLNPAAMLSARYVIAGTNEAAAIEAAVGAEATVSDITRPPSARDRFKVVPPKPEGPPPAVDQGQGEDSDDEKDDDDDDDIPF